LLRHRFDVFVARAGALDSIRFDFPVGSPERDLDGGSLQRKKDERCSEAVEYRPGELMATNRPRLAAELSEKKIQQEEINK
jgi:hypothetical protein